MPFLSPNQQCQSTEGKITRHDWRLNIYIMNELDISNADSGTLDTPPERDLKDTHIFSCTDHMPGTRTVGRPREKWI